MPPLGIKHNGILKTLGTKSKSLAYGLGTEHVGLGLISNEHCLFNTRVSAEANPTRLTKAKMNFIFRKSIKQLCFVYFLMKNVHNMKKKRQ